MTECLETPMMNRDLFPHSDTYVEGIARERRRGIELQLKSPSSTRLTTLTYRTLNNNQLLPTLLTLHV